MSNKLSEYSCADFASVLAAKEPVPGGGGAAALVGALGAALCSMVGNYTQGKKTYASVEEDVQRMLRDAEQLRQRLVELVDEDAVAFEPLSRAYGIPKDDPTRADVLEEATKGACAAPLEMMEQICKAIALLEEMGQKGSRMLASDIACGALLCKAALEAASVNVFVNTACLRDHELARSIEGRCDQMLEEYLVRADRCAREVIARIRKES